MRKLRLIVFTAIPLIVMVFGVIAIAHSNLKKRSVNPINNSSAQQYVGGAGPIQTGLIITPRQTTAQPDPCTKTVTEDTVKTGSNISNTTTTKSIKCLSHTQTGTTSINITNNSHQQATSGDSTGQTGSSSNTSTTQINVKMIH